MKRFLKITRLVIILGWRIVAAYFGWVIRYSNHPEKYPLQLRYRKVHELLDAVGRAMRIDWRLYNAERLLNRQKGTLLVANHLSVCDIVALLYLCEEPISFVSKVEVRKMPFVGRCVKILDGVFLDRDDPRQAIKAFRTVEKRMAEEGLSYVIFAEGTRAKGEKNGTVLPFHPGSFKIAYRAKAPILLYAETGTQRILGKGNDRRHLVQMSFLPPMPYDEYKDLQTVDLAPIAHERVESEFDHLLLEDAEYYKAGMQKQRIKDPGKEAHILRKAADEAR